jgi:HD-like signal output (HDOD) protein
MCSEGNGQPLEYSHRLTILDRYIRELPPFPSTIDKVLEICTQPNTSPYDIDGFSGEVE